MFGLSYLPTAQRLSFSLVKVNGIKVEKNNEENLSEFSNPHFKSIKNNYPYF